MTSAFEPLPISGAIRWAKYSLTYTFSSSSLASPLPVMAIARGCASATRDLTLPRNFFGWPTSGALRSTDPVCIIVAGSMTVSVPSTQLAT